MGQYWLTVNLTRGRYAYGGAAKLAELAGGTHARFSYPARLVAALRPGGLWSGHRVLLTGDYDDDRRGRVEAYLAVHGLTKKARQKDIDDTAGDGEVSTDCLYQLLSSGPLSGTDDHFELGWTNAQLWAEERAEQAPAGASAVAAVTAAELPQLVAVSHDSAQRLTVGAHNGRVALMCLLAESSGGGGGDIDVSFRGAWAGDRVEVLPADAVESRYADVTSAALKEVRKAVDSWRQW
jgi:hypothetical protein